MDNNYQSSDNLFYGSSSQKRYNEDLDINNKRQRITPSQFSLPHSSSSEESNSLLQPNYSSYMGSSSNQPGFQYPFRNTNILPPPSVQSGSTFPPSQQSEHWSHSSQPMGMQYPVMYFSSPPYLPRTSYPSLSSSTLTSPYQSMGHSTFPPTMPLQQTSIGSGPSSPPSSSSSSSGSSHNIINMDNNTDSTPSNYMFKYNQPIQMLDSTLDYMPQVSSTTSASSASSAQSATTRKPKTKSDPLKKKEGLEESSVRIISLLQTRGKMIFKDIHETLGIDYRRAYDILNILLTTTLITKVGKKRENKLPFIYQDGTPLPEPVELRDIVGDIQREEEANQLLKSRIQLLEEELAKEETSTNTGNASTTVSGAARGKDRDPLIVNDPLYKDVI